jgi:hypothetical protein
MASLIGHWEIEQVDLLPFDPVAMQYQNQYKVF